MGMWFSRAKDMAAWSITPKIPPKNLHIGQAVVAHGLGHLDRVGIVDAVHFGTL